MQELYDVKQKVFTLEEELKRKEQEKEEYTQTMETKLKQYEVSTYFYGMLMLIG